MQSIIHLHLFRIEEAIRYTLLVIIMMDIWIVYLGICGIMLVWSGWTIESNSCYVTRNCDSGLNMINNQSLFTWIIYEKSHIVCIVD